MNAHELVDYLATQIGTTEHPAGSNKTIYNRLAGHPNGQAWCATFVTAMLRRAGVDTRGIGVPSSRTMWSVARRKGYAVELADVQAGDVVHMTRGPLRRWLGHVGFAVASPRRTSSGVLVLDTIEGNTDGKGSATGGAVLRHARPLTAWNLGAWRPHYPPKGNP